MSNEKRIKELAKRYVVDSGKHFRLKDHDPGDTNGLKSEFKTQAQDLLKQSTQMLASQQDKLYAQDHWAVLLIFQAMDAAGKDGTIKHVMSGVNPQGCQVYSFKAPSAVEIDHDYLWRTYRVLPERGNIGIFNRSYYEEVLVVRVHQEILKAQRIPEGLISKKIWDERFEDINAMEKHLTRNGTVIRKFFLNVSKEEQKKRFLRRLEEPERNWKFSSADVKEREHWDEYQNAYEEMIANTASKHAPWIVVPADNKWFTRLVVSSVVVNTLQELDLAYPVFSEAQRKDLNASEVALKAEGRKGKRRAVSI